MLILALICTIFSISRVLSKCSFCGFKPKSSDTHYSKISLRTHLIKNHMKDHIENKIPKSEPFVCPIKTCFYSHFTSRFEDYDTLFKHYHKHIGKKHALKKYD